MSIVPERSLAERALDELGRAIDPTAGLDLMTLATVMVQSEFFPDLKGIAQGVVKILAGRELGFPPIASLRHIYVHRGHIGLQATLVATKIRQSGRYDYKIVRCDESVCEIQFFRVVNGQLESEGSSSFTIEEAHRAGLVRKDSAWETYPADVLFARAMTRGQRRFCPDVFGQTVYDVDEIREIAAHEPPPAAPSGLMPRRKDVPEVIPPTEITPPEPGPGEPQFDRETHVDAPVAAPEADPAAAPAPAPAAAPKTTFLLGAKTYETAGITREQLLEVFRLSDQLKKRTGGSDLAKAILSKEFSVASRIELTQEQGEQYLIRLREALEG